MAKLDPAAVTKKVYALLKGASPPERQAIVAATMTLFGEAVPHATAASNQGAGAGSGAGAGPAGGGSGGIRSFFEAKQPRTKLEELAVAARFLEKEGGRAHSKDDFSATFAAAKRPFDARHFARDMSNARRAKLFNTGKDNVLSYFGENYVDALPDHAKADGLKRPGKGRMKKAGGKKA